MTVMEHPEVAAAVMKGPKSLGSNRSLRQSDCDSSNLTLISVDIGISLTPYEAGSVKCKEQVVLIKKVEGDEALALALVDCSRSKKAERLNRNAECGRLGGGDGGPGGRLLYRFLLVAGK
jgi:hypothetical protein